MSSRIMLGLMRIGFLSEEKLYKLIKDCLDNGVTKFDIADIYGHKKCEKKLGNVLKEHPELRKKIYLQTKTGIAFETCGYDSSYDYIVKSVEEAIERLHCDYLDCYLIHRPDIFMDAGEVAKAINYLLGKGAIKDFGVSNFSASEIEYLQERLPCPIKYDQVQLGIGNTDMIDQTMYTNMPHKNVSKGPDDLFFYLKRNDIAIQCWSPYQYGLFGGSIFNKWKHRKINQCLNKYAKKYGATPCAIATAFLLKLDKRLLVITGSTDIEHIKESIQGEKVELSKEDWYRIYKGTGHVLP